MGKGVGGGSLINGLLWNRGGQVDFDIWEQLGNANWSWADLLPYFRKSESFTPQAYAGDNITDPDQMDTFNVTVHGFNGPAQVSYPEFLWPQTTLWFEALEELGVTKCLDPNDGTNGGGYFIPLSIEPDAQTRSDARRTYHDPAAQRPKYTLAIHAQVTRILFNGVDNEEAPAAPYSNTSTSRRFWKASQHQPAPLQATGVVFASGPDAPLQTAFARHEVILAAGAIHSPRLLELSGIGSRDILSLFNIPVLSELPGVGANLQDHAMIHLDYAYRNTSIQSVATFAKNTTFLAASENEYFASRTGPWAAKPSTAVAFPSLSHITNTTYTSQLIALASLDNASSYLPSSMQQDHTLLAGYNTILHHILSALNATTVPSHEILNSNSGGLDLSLMRPLSRGTTHIMSSSPWGPLAIDPHWLAHPLDFTIMQRAMEFNQRLLATPALAQLEPSFTHVPYNASPSILSTILKRGISTEFHYSSTLAMLPLSLGGVVDSNLTVYGTSNLRVVDSSIFSVVPGAHLQAVVYAVAEKAADIIKGGSQERRVEELMGQLGREVPTRGGWWEWFWEEVFGNGGRRSGHAHAKKRVNTHKRRQGRRHGHEKRHS